IKAWCLFICLIAAGGMERILADGCDCSKEQTVRFQLRGVATMAGHATLKISYGEIITNTTLITSNTIAPPDQYSTNYHATNYQCVQWAEEIRVEPKLDQPVFIEYLYETNKSSPDYTEFKSLDELNPATYYTRPSSKCLKVFFDRSEPGQTNWVPAT